MVVAPATSIKSNEIVLITFYLYRLINEISFFASFALGKATRHKKQQLVLSIHSSTLLQSCLHIPYAFLIGPPLTSVGILNLDTSPMVPSLLLRVAYQSVHPFGELFSRVSG